MTSIPENILSLSEAARAVPAMDGRRPHTASVWRWCRRGIKRNGRTVKLAYLRIGRRIAVKSESLNEFFVALAEADSAEDAAPIERQAAKFQPSVTHSRTPAQRQKAIDRARKSLAEA